MIQVLLVAAVLVAALAGHGWSGVSRVAATAVGLTMLALGVAMLVTAAVALGGALTPFPAPKRDGDVVDRGVYRLVRHPMYGGGLLLALGWTILFASVVSLVFTTLLAVFLDLKSRREERWLVERLDGYEAYRRATPRRLLPFVY